MNVKAILCFLLFILSSAMTKGQVSAYQPDTKVFRFRFGINTSFERLSEEALWQMGSFRIGWTWIDLHMDLSSRSLKSVYIVDN